jgi:hypothetical protein
MAKREPKKLGRKAKYETLKIADKLDWIQNAISNGNTEKSIVESLGVSIQTWEVWKSQEDKQALRDAIAQGRELRDRLVENKLFLKATGYELQEIEELQDDSGAVLQRKIKKKQYAGDTTAQIFWLKNKLPEEFKDRVDNTHQVGFEFNVKLEDDI